MKVASRSLPSFCFIALKVSQLAFTVSSVNSFSSFKSIVVNASSETTVSGPLSILLLMVDKDGILVVSFFSGVSSLTDAGGGSMGFSTFGTGSSSTGGMAAGAGGGEGISGCGALVATGVTTFFFRPPQLAETNLRLHSHSRFS